jgi:hypothetical protein
MQVPTYTRLLLSQFRTNLFFPTSAFLSMPSALAPAWLGKSRYAWGVGVEATDIGGGVPGTAMSGAGSLYGSKLIEPRAEALTLTSQRSGSPLWGSEMELLSPMTGTDTHRAARLAARRRELRIAMEEEKAAVEAAAAAEKESVISPPGTVGARSDASMSPVPFSLSSIGEDEDGAGRTPSKRGARKNARSQVMPAEEAHPDESTRRAGGTPLQPSSRKQSSRVPPSSSRKQGSSHRRRASGLQAFARTPSPSQPSRRAGVSLTSSSSSPAGSSSMASSRAGTLGSTIDVRSERERYKRGMVAQAISADEQRARVHARASQLNRVLEHKAAVKLQTAYRQWHRRTEGDSQARAALRRVRQSPGGSADESSPAAPRNLAAKPRLYEWTSQVKPSQARKRTSPNKQLPAEQEGDIVDPMVARDAAAASGAPGSAISVRESARTAPNSACSSPFSSRSLIGGGAALSEAPSVPLPASPHFAPFSGNAIIKGKTPRRPGVPSEEEEKEMRRRAALAAAEKRKRASLAKAQVRDRQAKLAMLLESGHATVVQKYARRWLLRRQNKLRLAANAAAGAP